MSCPHDMRVSDQCTNHEQLKSNKLLMKFKIQAFIIHLFK